MAYYVDLFSPQTYEAFSSSNRDISGFRPRQENAASRVQVGDKLICYLGRERRERKGERKGSDPNGTTLRELSF